MQRPSNLKVGDKFRVVANNNSHGFKIGEVVSFKEDQGGKELVFENETDFWWVFFDDLEPLNKTILKEMPDTVVHCKTKEEYDELMQIYEDAGWEYGYGKISDCSFEEQKNHDGTALVTAKNRFDHRWDVDKKILSLQEFKEAQGLVEKVEGMFTTDMSQLSAYYEFKPVWHSVSDYKSSSTKKRKGIMSYLKPVTTFIDSQKLPMKNYLRLGWVEVENNDFVVTREGERADSFARIVLGITMAEHAAAEVKRLEKECKK